MALTPVTAPAVADAELERIIAAAGRRLHLQGADADDFRQEARLLWFRKGDRILRSFRHDAQITTYLFKTFLRMGIRMHRQARMPSIDYSPNAEHRLAYMASASHADDLILKHERVKARCDQIVRLRSARATMTETDRMLLEARFDQGLPVNEIARRLSTTPGAVSMRIQRAVTRLRLALSS
jgi:RNA polymerase sigma factor (sigma-70 family)